MSMVTLNLATESNALSSHLAAKMERHIPAARQLPVALHSYVCQIRLWPPMPGQISAR
jgi:hypothetical protein